VRRETYIGPWLPEPIITDEEHDGFAEASLHESLSMAFLVLLERLTPVERAVFLLREVFDYSYAEIAEIVAKEEVACRQIFSRAKKYLAAQRPRFSPSREHHHLILQRFMQAIGTGDLDGLIQMLTADVTLQADGGGQVPGAATRVVYGPTSVARFVLGSVRFLQGPHNAELTTVNGEPAVILRVDGRPVVVVSYTFDQDMISAIRIMGNPDKLRHIPNM
jgi:RNA polymerase sigma-70 factor (ECF subfamily)